MRMLKAARAVPFLVLAVFLFAATGALAERPAPKLIVQITVDQLRGDMPLRFKDRFGPDGFRYLMDHGTVYTNAHYTHSTTFTAVGHAVLATGGMASTHGLAGNDWYNVATGQRVYCVEDPDNPILGTKPSAKNRHKGTSPRNLTSTSAGDELVLATGGKSRAFSVSIKDRGAILPGGKLGKAFWYSKSTGKFVTSTYYYDEYPAWVKAWNAADHAGKYRDVTWIPKNDQSTYVYGDLDDRPGEKGYKHLGRTFPKPLGAKKDSDYYKALRFTPMGDAVTLDFVKELMKQEKVGQGPATDYLAVSFSATDYLGHAWGPNSLEAEDNVLRMDDTLAEFFGYIDETVGLDKTLIVLSSDHGIDTIPEEVAKKQISAGRFFPQKFMLQLNSALQQRYNSKDEFVTAFWNPSFYLNLETVKKLNLNLAEVEQALAEEVVKIPGFARAFTRTEVMTGQMPDDPIADKVFEAFHPTRSGNVLVVQDQGWYLYPRAELFAAMHGSPYSYDTYVPIMFAGPGVKAQVINRRVAPGDIAPTITGYLGIKPPTGAIGSILTEVLEGDKRTM